MDVYLSFFVLFAKYVDCITYPIYWLLAFLRPHQKLPTIDNSLLLKSATELADLIRNKQVTSQEIVKVYINRIRSVNPIINAVVEERFEDAIKEAKEVDAVLMQSNVEEIAILEKSKPFYGVPVTIKESCSLKGMSYVGGTRKRVGIRAPKDGAAVSRVKAAGAIPLLVSNTPELCLGMETHNMITGRSRNPFDTTRTPGGSSGGEGALISAAGSVIGVGSDIAGSIRIPALYCGIFGHKPTPGLVPLEGQYPGNLENELFCSYLTMGPLARYSIDLEPMLKVMAGDSYFEHLNPNEDINLKNLKVLYLYHEVQNKCILPTHKSIRQAIDRGVKYLKDEFNLDHVEKAKFDFSESLEVLTTLMFSIPDAENLLYNEKTGKTDNVYIELIKLFLGFGKYSYTALEYRMVRSQQKYADEKLINMCKKKVNEWKDEIIKSIGANGVFIYPTMPESAFYHNQCSIKSLFILYPMLFNVLGLPCTHVPMGLDENGLPIGFQIVAAPNRDRLTIAVARKLEEQFGGWTPPS